MNRGTRVAQAYVALTADGSNIDDDIAKSFDDVDWDKLAKKGDEEFWKNFRKHMGKDKGGKSGVYRSLMRTLSEFSKAIETDSAVQKSVENMLTMQDNQKRLNTIYRHVAKESGLEFSGEFVDVVKAATHRRLRKALIDAAKGGRSEEEVMSSILGSYQAGDSKALTVGPEIKKIIKDLETFRKNVDKSVYEEAERLDRIFDEDKRARIKRQGAMERANDRFAFEGRMMTLQAEEKARKKLQDRMDFSAAYERAAREAQRVFSNVKFDPRIDEKSIRRARVDLQRLLMDREGLKVRLASADPKDILKIERQIDSIDGKIEVYLDRERLQRQLAMAEGLVDRSGRRIVHRSQRWFQDRALADRMGQLTGMGARNNFLNLFGRMVRMVSNVTFSAVRGVTALTKGVISLGSAFAEGAASAGQGASVMARAGAGFSAVAARMAPMLAGLAASLPTLAISAAVLGVALVALTAVMSMLVSAVAALLGVLTALVSTIVSGLTGALTVALAAFVPVIAAGGALVTMFMSMNDAQKKAMKETFTPLREIFVGLGQTMLKDVIPAFSTWSNNLQQAATLLIPLADKLGAVFAEAGTRITASLSGPGFQNLSAALGEHLPRIILSLSNAFGSLLNGLSGMFAALMPFVERFADYLARVTERFSQWANSAKGQNSIVDFTERAWESMKSLWNFIREFVGWVRDVLFNPAVQEFGNTMFDGLAKSFRRLRDNIADGSLERWMKDAERFGRALWETIQSLWGVFESLYKSGAIDAVIVALEALGWVFDRVKDILDGFIALIKGDLPDSITGLVPLFNPLVTVLYSVQTAAEHATSALSNFLKVRGVDAKWFGLGGGTAPTPFADSLIDPRTQHNMDNAKKAASGESWTAYYARWKRDQARLDSLRRSGASAISNTDRPDPTKVDPPKWVNPYVAWAEGLIKDGPTMNKQIKTAIKQMGKQAAKTIREAVNSDTGKEARQGLAQMRKDLRAQGKDLVQTARSSLNSAASSLASATTPEDAAKALAAVRKAQSDLAKAQTTQKRLNAAAKLLDKQREISSKRVNRLLAGRTAPNATLADYARAQERLAVLLENAKNKLTEAITLRDDFAKAVSDSVRSFGSILSAQGEMIDGVEQALTHKDITGNLRDRLQQIRDFQNNLRSLQAMGVSDAVYKQIVDAGVEEGGRFAEALLDGGASAIMTANNLTAEIDKIAGNLGYETSRSLYQAGVDAAKGLVDGLTSLSKELDQAAARLGDSIAKAIRRQLGIKSPSTVLIGDMDYVGDGAVIGLGRQEAKVTEASEKFASYIRPNLTAPASAVASSSGGVSGNGGITNNWHITTPTENPKAVAWEMMDEMVGRL